MKKLSALFFSFLFIGQLALAVPGTPKENLTLTGLKKIFLNPQAFVDSYVSVKATFQGWRGAEGRPPVTRSDWVAKGDDGFAIYCTGPFPAGLDPFEAGSMGRMVNILGKVALDQSGKPYIVVSEALPLLEKPEMMVAVSQILFDPVGMRGKKVGLLGVLAKGFGHRGNRIYFLADPSGAITIERLPKLYPKGTILQVRGYVGFDENGLPELQNVEIISAKN